MSDIISCYLWLDTFRNWKSLNAIVQWSDQKRWECGVYQKWLVFIKVVLGGYSKCPNNPDLSEAQRPPEQANKTYDILHFHHRPTLGLYPRWLLQRFMFWCASFYKTFYTWLLKTILTLKWKYKKLTLNEIWGQFDPKTWLNLSTLV